MAEQSAVRDQLADQLRESYAHHNFEQVVKGLTPQEAGKRPGNSPYSIWELVEHIRIAQWDIVSFSKGPGHESPEWPKGYWPDSSAPADAKTWNRTVKAIEDDRNTMIKMVTDSNNDLFKPFSWGTGQTLFREAMLIIDHTSYHLGQIVVIRKLLENW